MTDNYVVSCRVILLTKNNNKTDELFSFKYSKMLSFSQVAEALTGLIYHRPSGENFSSVSFYLFDFLSVLGASEHLK